MGEELDDPSDHDLYSLPKADEILTLTDLQVEEAKVREAQIKLRRSKLQSQMILVNFPLKALLNLDS